MYEAGSACRSCSTAVPPTSTICPECGYNVASHDRWRFIWGLPGTVMVLTVVLAPLGIPMLWKAYQHRLAAEGTVTAKRSTSNILRGVLTINEPAEQWPPWEAKGEFTRGGSTRATNDVSRND